MLIEYRTSIIPLIGVAVLLSSIACATHGDGSEGSETEHRKATPATSGSGDEAAGVTLPASRVFVLLANMRLAVIDADQGEVVFESELGEPSDELMSAGHYLAVGSDHRLFVLVPGPSGTSDRVLVIDSTTGMQQRSLELESEVTYRAIDVADESGTVYLFGNRRSDEVVVVAIEPLTGLVSSRWFHRYEDGRSWDVYQGKTRSEEDRVFVSYHGEDTTGVDWFELDESFSVCSAPRVRPGFGCIPSHGAFWISGSRLLVATGTSRVVEVAISDEQEPSESRELETRLEGNHLMEFSVRTDGRVLAAIGPCYYSGGLSVLNLDSGEVDILIADGQRTVCGDRIAIGPEGSLFVAVVRSPIGQGTEEDRYALLIVDGTNAQLLHDVALPARPLDLLPLVD